MKMFRIVFVSWQNENIHYGNLGGIYTDKEKAEIRADAWNAEHQWYDDRRAVVVVV